MYTITINHKDVGKTTYTVYKESEAKEKKLNYKHWQKAEEGSYALSDDGYVARVIKRKTYKAKSTDMDYIRFPWGYTFYNHNYSNRPLNAANRKSNTTLTGKSYIEAHKNSQIVKDLAMFCAWKSDHDAAIEWVLGDDVEAWKRKKWKRTMKSEVFRSMVREELIKRLTDHGLTDDYTLDLFERTIKMATDKKDVTNLMRAVENLQDMHGMKDKHLEKTVNTLEAHSNVQLLDDIMEEEKHIKLESVVTKDE